MEQGKVLLPQHALWLEAFQSELLAFPNGAHDDQVDVLAYAAEVKRGQRQSLLLAGAHLRGPRRPDIFEDLRLNAPDMNRFSPNGRRPSRRLFRYE